MKRLIFYFLVLLFMWVVPLQADAASKFFAAVGLTGGGDGDLDKIDGDLLSDDDAAYVVTSTDFYVYHLNASSGAAESSPDVISPDTNAGNKRWVLIYQGDAAMADMTQLTPTAGNVIYGTGTTWAGLAAGATDEILVGGGAAVPVWTTATGTGAPVRATAPTLAGLTCNTTDATLSSVNLNMSSTYGLMWDSDTESVTRQADDKIVIQTQGTDRLTVLSNGKVGIGVTAPVNNLSILNDLDIGSATDPSFGLGISDTGTSAATVALLFGVDNALNFGLIQSMDPGDSWSNRALVLQPRGGDVSIGDTTPDTNFTLDVGGVVRAQSGIQPNGNAYAAAEVLDDYEEGTWTPAYTNATPPTTPYTMDIVFAKYTKIGRVVTINAFIRTSDVDITGAAGVMLISGLPFTNASGNSYNGAAVTYAIAWGTNTPVGGYIANAGTTISLMTQAASNGTFSSMYATDLTAGTTAQQNQTILTATYYSE